MQSMIFGIGPYPEEGSEFPSCLVYVTDRKTWDQTQDCNEMIDEEVRDELDKAGFAEMQEACFESTNTSFTKEQIHQTIQDLGYVHNKDFENYMIEAMGE